MRFIRDDYKEKQKKKRGVIATAVSVFLVVVIWYIFIRTPVTPGGQEKAPIIQQTEAAKESSPKKTASPAVIDLPTLIKRVKPSIVLIHTMDLKGNPIGQGSGFFINDRGHVVSNRHVFQGAHRVEIKSTKGTYKVKKILAEDSKNDLILVSLDTKTSGFTSLSFAEKDVEVGEKIVVIGNPLGLDATVSDGIVSARRNLDNFGKVIQVTSPISPGSSGSPVLNMQGKVIGVATFQLLGGQNLNFAVPVDKVQKLVPVQSDEKDVTDLSFVDSSIMASAEDPLSRGIIYYNAGEYENAIAELQTALKDNPMNAEIHFYLGMCYMQQQYTDAVDAFKQAVDLNPQYVEAYFNLGIVYNKLEMFTEAISALRQVLQLEPEHPGALLQIGIAYAMIKEFRAAVSMLEKVAEMEMDSKAYFALGISYAGLKMNTEAIRALQTAIDLDGEFIEAYLALGYVFAEVKNWRQGIKLFNRAVLIEPENPAVRFLLGLMHLGSGDVSTAERQCEVLRNMRTSESSKFESQLRNAISRYNAYKQYRGY